MLLLPAITNALIRIFSSVASSTTSKQYTLDPLSRFASIITCLLDTDFASCLGFCSGSGADFLAIFEEAVCFGGYSFTRSSGFGSMCRLGRSFVAIGRRSSRVILLLALCLVRCLDLGLASETFAVYLGTFRCTIGNVLEGKVVVA